MRTSIALHLSIATGLWHECTLCCIDSFLIVCCAVVCVCVRVCVFFLSCNCNGYRSFQYLEEVEIKKT